MTRNLAPVVVAVAAVALSSCGSQALEHQGQTIDNAQEILDEANVRFSDLIRDQIDAGTMTASDDSQCFLSLDGADEEPAIYCGPVRSAGDESEAPWYQFPVRASSTGEGYTIALEADDPTRKPVDLELLAHPDGDEPAEPSNLQAPELPAAPATDFALLTHDTAGEVSGALDPIDEPYRLITPSVELTIEAAGLVEQIPGDVIERVTDSPTAGATTPDAYRPADGQTVHAWQVTIHSPEEATTTELDKVRDRSTTLSIIDGETSIAITSELQNADGTAGLHCTDRECDELPTNEYTLLATGTEPSLVATTDGATQTLDLTSGELTSDVSTVAYSRPSAATLTVNHAWEPTTYLARTEAELEAEFGNAMHDMTRDGAGYTYGGEIRNIHLSAFNNREGWAPSGKAWLTIPIHNDPSHATGWWEANLDMAQTWTLRTSDGQSVPHDIAAGGDEVPTFLVDDDATGGTLTYQPTGAVQFGHPEATYTLDAAPELAAEIAIR